MCDPENIRRIEMLDVDWLGFVFYEGSPRFVRENDATKAAIYQCMKPKVGVFVDESLDVMLTKAEMYRLSYLQLHGSETPEMCWALQQSGYQVLKVFAVASAEDFEQTGKYAGCCDYFLFDTKCRGYGGSGKRFDWALLDAYRGEKPFILSGGLTVESFDDIRQMKHPMMAGVDLNSGFEIAVGVKDGGRIGMFVGQIRMLATNYTNLHE